MNVLIVEEQGVDLLSAPKGYVLAHIASNAVIKLINWDFRKEWAQVEYKGRLGCVLKNGIQKTEMPICEEPDKMEQDKEEEPDLSCGLPLYEQYRSDSSVNFASGQDRPYVVIQVTLKEQFVGTGSKNLRELEDVINAQAERGYRLHTFSTVSAESVGFGGGDRIQATMVFEKI